MFKAIEQAMDRKPEDDEIQRQLDATPFMEEYRKKIGMIAFSFLTAFFALGIFYMSAKMVKPANVQLVPADGRAVIARTMPLPNQTRQAVKDWAREAVQKSYTFDFRSIDKGLASAENYFTPDAWVAFNEAIKKSSLVSDVKKNRFSVTLVLKEEPIIDGGAISGSQEVAWKVLVPVTMSFSGDAPTVSKDMLIKLTIVRVPTTENPKGMGVLQMGSGLIPYKKASK